jgi:hypothetical protein
MPRSTGFDRRLTAIGQRLPTRRRILKPWNVLFTDEEDARLYALADRMAGGGSLTAEDRMFLAQLRANTCEDSKKLRREMCEKYRVRYFCAERPNDECL